MRWVGDGVKNREGDKGDERDRIFTTMGSHPFNNIRGVKCANYIVGAYYKHIIRTFKSA